jgi:hypothetical protein
VIITSLIKESVELIKLITLEWHHKLFIRIYVYLGPKELSEFLLSDGTLSVFIYHVKHVHNIFVIFLHSFVHVLSNLF